MVRGREQFEDAFDRVIAAHGRKVRAAVDACACGTSDDWKRCHETEAAYHHARDAFLDEVFAPLLPPPAPVVVLVGHEAQQRGRTRGRPLVWQRWIEARIVWRGILYTFTAPADALVADSEAELGGAGFDPLDAEHTIRFRGLPYTTSDAAPAEVKALVVEACRGAARRLLVQGARYEAAWPAGWPSFAALVAGEGKA